MAETLNKDVQASLNLKDFKLTEILFNNAAKRSIWLLGKFLALSEDDQAIVTIEKVEFVEENFTTDNDEEAFLKHTELETILSNDIYRNFYGLSDQKFNKLKVSIIYPATEKHIQKYSRQDYFLIKETPDMYNNVTLPYLKKEQFTLDWVYNILEHKQEVDKIKFEDLDPKTGFILLPDYKWNGQIESLYWLAIVMDRKIKSIRDLNDSHLPLLENLRSKSLQTIKTLCNIDESQIRAYFHYQPSFYHLHVHFTYLKYDAPGIFCEKSHLLDSVINNIKLVPDYYQKSTLTFCVGEKDKLYLAIKASENATQESPASE